MNKNIKIYDIFQLIEFLNRNLKKILFLTFAISLIPIIFFSYKHLNNNFSYKFINTIEVLPETLNELELISSNISNIKNNPFLSQMSSRLQLQYFDYKSGKLESEKFISFDNKNNSELFANNFFSLVNKFFKDYQDSNPNVNLSHDFMNNKKNSSLFTIEINSDYVQNIDTDTIINEILFSLNNFIKSSIKSEFLNAMKYYKIDKENLLTSIDKLNELAIQAHILDLNNQLIKMEDDLKIAKELNLKRPYMMDYFSDSASAETQELYIIRDNYDNYLQGIDVLELQINNIKANLKNSKELPIISLNIYFYNLISSDFFIEAIKEKIQVSNIFKEDYEIVTITDTVVKNNALSSNYILSMIVISFIFIFIFVFLIFLLIELYENYKLKD